MLEMLLFSVPNDSVLIWVFSSTVCRNLLTSNEMQQIVTAISQSIGEPLLLHCSLFIIPFNDCDSRRVFFLITLSIICIKSSCYLFDINYFKYIYYLFDMNYLP